MHIGKIRQKLAWGKCVTLTISDDGRAVVVESMKLG